ncbi:MAG TPA: polysaccharide deacetylase family protein, partial [Mobilitalea sp.]|nr:polysaccharide deacetylase family protein [Mobilitalea sp.]
IGKYINDQTVPIMERELKLGCEIHNHSWNHYDMTKLTQEQIKKEIQDTSDKINETVGVTPKFFRPPFILTNPVMYQTIQLPFINGINGTDWDATVTAEKRSELILNQAEDGDIILLHDLTGNDKTVKALDTIIPGLKEKGFVFVTVSQLFDAKGIEPNVEGEIWTHVTK